MSSPPTKKKKCSMSSDHQATLFEVWGSSTSCGLSGAEVEQDSGKSQESTSLSQDESKSSSSSLVRDSSICEDSWEGCSLSDIAFGPSCTPVLPPLSPAINHTVLFVPPRRAGDIPTPYPAQFKDVWDSKHVRMPCSKLSLYPVGKQLCPRWDLVQQSLEKPIYNSYDLEEAILTYNSVYSKKWQFNGLHAYFSKLPKEESSMFFAKTLPKIIKLALQMPSVVTHSLPLLRKQERYAISLSQKQILCLLANAFLCTFPRRNTSSASSEFSTYPSINFNSLYSSDAPGNSISLTRFNKLTCICHYFNRTTSDIPDGIVTFERKVLTSPPSWDKSCALFTNLHVDSKGTIEQNGLGMLQVDFANKFIGGGVLGHGCLQEEIRFLICPELIVSRLFTEVLDHNEAVEVTGVEMYSTYKGYGSSFEWTGDCDDNTPRDLWGRRQTTIIAIDAMKFSSKAVQFKAGNLRREVNKAYCGFMTNSDYVTSSGKHMAVATGNWGCGAFGGDARLKFLLQLIAAAEAGRDVVYFTFGDRSLLKSISNLHRGLLAKKCTVGDVWNAVLQYDENNHLVAQCFFNYLETSLNL